MKNRIILLATALLCAIAICLSAIPALAVFAEGETPDLTNVALNALVEINDANTIEEGTTWGVNFLVDGNTTTAWHSDYINTDGTNPDDPTKLTISLGGECEISSISVYAYTGPTYESAFWDPPILVPVLPQAYTLEVFSVEENAWVEVADYTIAADWNIEVADPAETTFDFDPVVATKVRVTIDQNGGYWDPAAFRSGITLIADVAVMGYALGGSTETETETETSAPVDSELYDVALNQYAEATFSIEGGGWGAQGLLAGLKSDAKLANNDPAGWHHDMSGTISAMHAPEITVYLDRVYTIYTIDLYPVNAYDDAYVSVMPQEFTIELSADGGQTWVTVATETGVVSQVAGMEGHQDNGGLPAINVPYSIVLDEATDANVFRMTITKGGTGRSSNTMLPDPTYGGVYAPFTSIGSIEMLGVESENQPETVTETETETETETVTETETETETVVETVVESEVESADESDVAEESDTTAETVVDETAADTGVEETVADTTAATDAPAADADEGCASVVGFGAVAVLTAAAAAVVLKKKD